MGREDEETVEPTKGRVAAAGREETEEATTGTDGSDDRGAEEDAVGRGTN